MNQRSDFIFFVFLVLFISQITCQESTLSLQGFKSVKISSDISGSSIGIGSSKEVEKDSILIQIVGPSGNIATVTQKKTGDTLEISISEEVSSSSCACQPKPQLSSSYITFIVVGVCSFFLPKYRWLAVTLTLLIYCTVKVASCGTNNTQTDITILFAQDQELDELKVISSGSILASPGLFSQFGKLQCGSSSSNLNECTNMLCNSDKRDDCYSSLYDNSLAIGILISSTGDYELLATEFHDSLEFAVDHFGAQYPRVQFISADTMSSASVALEKAKEMYNHGIRAFIGPFLGDEAIEVLNWSQTVKEKTVFLSPTVSTNKFSNYPNLYSLSPSNNDSAIVYCAYLDYYYSHALDELLIVHVDDDHGKDFTNSIMQKCVQTNYNVTVIASYAANSIKSAGDATKYLQTIDNSIKSKLNQAVLFISYGEIQYFLESAGQNQLATEIHWYGTNFGLNERVISTPILLNTARTVQLRSLQYAGSEIDITDKNRRNFFKELRKRAGSASPISALPYDAAMLYYLTTRGEKISIDILSKRLRVSGDNIYGMSGWLELNPNGFRESGEYHSSYVPSKSSMLNLTWSQDLTVVFEELDVPAMPYRMDFLPVTGHGISSESFQGCGFYELSALYETATAHETFVYLSYDDLKEGLASNQYFLIPSFSNITLWNACDNTAGITFCAANDYAAASACFESKSVDRKRFSTYEPPKEEPVAFFVSDVLILAPTDNLFTSFEGAPGTTVANENSVAKTMNLTTKFP